ncbi:MAG: hypothetical protein IPG45_04885 [Deltaproteobacteria bacterium]|nr:hypothetical protein [Deltaproteobacteria bacterium]
MGIKLSLAVGLMTALFAERAFAQDAPAKESNCGDRIDEDKDSVTDCADADCYSDPACKTAGGTENNNTLCSDFVDNDSDGAVDCEDQDCQGEGVTACRGSWQGPLDGTGVAGGGGGGGGGNSGGDAPLPELKSGMSVEDLIGTGSDIDGERNELACADGVDNDGDGAIDCADIGCRFDPEINVCRGTPGIRFGLAAHVQTSYDFENEVWDTRFNRLQLRTFGPLPFIQDSFFLLSFRAEQTIRLTFALINLPIKNGHYLNINSGGGGLSNIGIISVSKNLMLDPAFYLNNAFERGNGAAAEIGGPLVGGLIDYRAFVAGGSGEFNGNIGGRFFRGTDRNYTWGAGAQLAFFPVGRFDRWDTRYLYTEVPTSLSIYLGARFDQRNEERFPAANASAMFRSGRFLATLEGWGKRELNFETWQMSGRAELGILLIPKWLLLGADIGAYYSSDFGVKPPQISDELQRLVDQVQWRVVLHFFAWRSTGLISLLYTDNLTESATVDAPDLHTREVRVEAQIRFGS